MSDDADEEKEKRRRRLLGLGSDDEATEADAKLAAAKAEKERKRRLLGLDEETNVAVVTEANTQEAAKEARRRKLLGLDQETEDSGVLSIEDWLREIDSGTGRYLRYLEGFSREYETLNDIALDPDIPAILQAVKVEARGDGRRLTEAIQALQEKKAADDGLQNEATVRINGGAQEQEQEEQQEQQEVGTARPRCREGGDDGQHDGQQPSSQETTTTIGADAPAPARVPPQQMSPADVARDNAPPDGISPDRLEQLRSQLSLLQPWQGHGPSSATRRSEQEVLERCTQYIGGCVEDGELVLKAWMVGSVNEWGGRQER
jgi:hypothetical protein